MVFDSSEVCVELRFKNKNFCMLQNTLNRGVKIKQKKICYLIWDRNDFPPQVWNCRRYRKVAICVTFTVVGLIYPGMMQVIHWDYIQLALYSSAVEMSFKPKRKLFSSARVREGLNIKRKNNNVVPSFK